MSQPADPLLDLIRHVRRRMVLARAGWVLLVVTFGIALVAAVVPLVARWIPMGLSPQFMFVAASLIALASVAVSIIRCWPSNHRVAQHLDDTLGLHELLASALASTSREDGAHRSLRAMAADVAGRIRVAEVRVDSPPPVMAIAAVLFLAATISFALVVQPTTAKREDRGTTSAQAVRPPSAWDESSSSARAAEIENPPRATSVTDVGVSPTAIPSSDDAANMPSHPDASGDAAAGGSRGRTDLSTSHVELAMDSAREPRREDRDRSQTAIAGGHSGVEATNIGGATPSVRAGASSPRIPAGDRSDRGRSGSENTADSAQPTAFPPVAWHVPDRHRDLIRAYFDADPSVARPSDSPR